CARDVYGSGCDYW
nr:immunoglobulin heavy chain junction region [Macaca mulatta]MOX60830.1 immunoglobulin heavy chain junction region [Macaca mulatta]MOX60972.1 immunoglobulin heavy chain junction region [Macaca mulatta]MOX61742.1 immunoglobulin heavy chain junction region [Macaca mulatta]MOX62567.1 immunoglobulin heavy chain junction region [Macaca mulatta]